MDKIHVVTKPSSGESSLKIGAPKDQKRRGIGKKGQRYVSQYEKNRSREVAGRTRLLVLKVQEFERSLLDRRQFEREMAYVFSTIRGIIAASKLPDRDKRDVYVNLPAPAELLEKVARQQRESEYVANGNGHSAGNGHDDELDSVI
jgi:hypothetical protein